MGVGIDEASRQERGELLVRDSGSPAEVLRDGEPLDGLGRGRSRGEASQVGQRDRAVGEQLILGPREAESLHEDVAPAVARRVRSLQGVRRAKSLHHLVEGCLESHEMGAQRRERLVERQGRREALGREPLVCHRIDVGRGGHQLGRGRAVRCVVALEVIEREVVVDEILQRLVDHVDVGQRRVRVLAAQREMLQVGVDAPAGPRSGSPSRWSVDRGTPAGRRSTPQGSGPNDSARTGSSPSSRRATRASASRSHRPRRRTELRWWD